MASLSKMDEELAFDRTLHNGTTDGEDAPSVDSGHQSYRAEALAQVQLAFPVCCTFVLRKSVDIVSVMFVGHLGPHFLSAAGIAAVTSNVTGNSMVVGFAGALSTICSQAFGSKDMRTFGVAPQRAVLILGLFICLPISILWWYSESVMKSFGQVRQKYFSSSNGFYYWRTFINSLRHTYLLFVTFMIGTESMAAFF